MKTNEQETRFICKDKQIVRDKVLEIATANGGRLFDFYGWGEFYRLVKEKYPWLKITSIDNSPRIKHILGKLPGTMFISFTMYVRYAKERNITFRTLFLDLCGNYSPKSRKVLRQSTIIMEKSGVILITLLRGREHEMRSYECRGNFNTRSITNIKLLYKKCGYEILPFWEHSYLSPPPNETRGTCNMQTIAFRYWKINNTK
jgi:hypothetical protein